MSEIRASKSIGEDSELLYNYDEGSPESEFWIHVSAANRRSQKTDEVEPTSLKH
jgi:hypothetical protein